MKRNDPCWCGTGRKIKHCTCVNIHYPHLSNELKKIYKREDILIKNSDQIDRIRDAGYLAAEILDKTAAKAKAGVTTEELNAYAHHLHIQAQASPAPLGYGSPPFPKSICTSKNDVICHGIPDHVPLKNGDIMNIDVTANLNGYYGDCSKMVFIGETNERHRQVSQASLDALMASIKILKPGVLLSEIGKEITKIAHQANCSIVKDFVGHGVGLRFHEGPNILHYENQMHIPLMPGMIFTIEPMLNEGGLSYYIDHDDWTVRTKDGKVSAQWEHTILITPTGYEILTPWKIDTF